jgi:hypothetical protein
MQTDPPRTGLGYPSDDPRYVGDRVGPGSIQDPAISLAEIDALRVAREEQLRKAAGRNLWLGVMIGVLLSLLGIGIYATSQGSFQEAGREADGGVTDLSRATGEAARTTGESVDESLANARNAAEPSK